MKTWNVGEVAYRFAEGSVTKVEILESKRLNHYTVKYPCGTVITDIWGMTLEKTIDDAILRAKMNITRLEFCLEELEKEKLSLSHKG